MKISYNFASGFNFRFDKQEGLDVYNEYKKRFVKGTKDCETILQHGKVATEIMQDIIERKTK